MTKLSAAEILERIKNPEAAAADRAAAFPMGTRVHRAREAENARARQWMKRLIRPENVEALLDQFPSANGDITHAVIPGDFVFCDLITSAVRRWRPSRIAIATLSLSEPNVRALESISEIPISLALSHFFQNTNKTIFRAVETRLRSKPGFRLCVARIHAKVVCLDIPGRPVVIETSAELLRWHLGWLDELHPA